jgi:uncharacterized membrane protein YgcG
MPWFVKSLGPVVVKIGFETEQEARDKMADLISRPMYANQELFVEFEYAASRGPKSRPLRPTRRKSGGRGSTRGGGRSSGGGGTPAGAKRRRNRRPRRSGGRR